MQKIIELEQYLATVKQHFPRVGKINLHEIFMNMIDYGTKLEYPDFIIKMTVDLEKDARRSDQIKKINQNIKILLKQNFNISIMRGIDKSKYYVMITCELDHLQTACQDLRTLA